MSIYDNQYWDNGTNVFSSASFTRVPYTDANYVAFLAAGNSPLPDPGVTALRILLNANGIGQKPWASLFASIQALTAPQLANVITDLTSLVGGLPKWSVGPQTSNLKLNGAVFSLAGGVPASFTTLVKNDFIFNYLADNLLYLINPSFDATINVNPMVF